MNEANLIDARTLDVAYGRRSGLSDVSLSLRGGELVGLLGPNGAGKSTALRALTAAIPIQRGTILIEGDNLADLRPRDVARRVAVVTGDAPTLFSFTVREIVEMGRYARRGPFEPLDAEDQEIIDASLESADLGSLAEREIQSLSAGESQRALIARALAQRCRAMLLDEPVAHLDLRHQIQLFGLLKRLCAQKGVGVLCVLHDLNLAAEFCDRVVLLDQGETVGEGKPADTLTNDLLQRVYRTRVGVAENPFTGRPVTLLRSEEKDNAR
jgi:iron complex transport system ATP-binding protein